MSEQYFYGHGKLLLSSEYFVLDGATSIALPTKLGQGMHVNYRPSNNPILYWRSLDSKEKCWFETKLELWHFDSIDDGEVTPEVETLQNILRQARKQNIHFLRDGCDVHVTTTLEFPTNWGLGSSSTLIYNIAQWAYVSPFELSNKTFSGSGYDIACAQSMGPITYQIQSRGPHWETVTFNPTFKDNLFFVYLNKKQNSRDGIQRYRDLVGDNKDEIVKKLNTITESMLSVVDIKEFEELIFEHENIISKAIDLPRIKESHFSDYWGSVKSLGAWGGDFVLATSTKSEKETKEYFEKRGHTAILSFDELILQNFEKYGEVLSSVEDEVAKFNSTQQ
jgi:mevalonate kinase